MRFPAPQERYVKSPFPSLFFFPSRVEKGLPFPFLFGTPQTRALLFPISHRLHCPRNSVGHSLFRLLAEKWPFFSLKIKKRAAIVHLPPPPGRQETPFFFLSTSKAFFFFFSAFARTHLRLSSLFFSLRILFLPAAESRLCYPPFRGSSG